MWFNYICTENKIDEKMVWSKVLCMSIKCKTLCQTMAQCIAEFSQDAGKFKTI